MISDPSRCVPSNALVPQVVAMLSSRHMRMSHYLWHHARDMWNVIGSARQQRFIQRFEWFPPRPGLDRNGVPIMDDEDGVGPGLDFLFAHRHMLRQVNAMQTRFGGAPLVGWDAPPRAGDQRFPVSPFPLGMRGKDDRVWERLIDDFESRRRSGGFRSLSHLGSYIEYGLHNAMHERFATPPVIERLDPPLSAGWPEPDPRFHHPSYDYLADQYAAHVNPYFWLIHVWIDGLIEEWEAAHGPTNTDQVWLGPMAHCH